MNATRLTSLRSGGVNPSSMGRRPSSDPSASRTMARARNPRDRSRRLAQPIATAAPRTTNATASTFCMTATTPCTVKSSGGAGVFDRRHLAYQNRDGLWIPLMRRTVDQNRHGLLDRESRPIRAVVDQSVERITHGDDASQAWDLPRAEAVGVAATVETLVV